MNAAIERMRADGMIGPAVTQPSNACPCGDHAAHVVMRRETADGVRLAVWSDGSITHHSSFGAHIRGIGVPRTAFMRNWRRRAVLALADDFGRFDLAELPGLIKGMEGAFAHTWRSLDDQRAWAIRRATGRRVEVTP